MPSSEAERFTLHQTLRSLMPEAVADTLMAHLPPSGWSDVAHKSDIESLRDAVKHDIDELRATTQQQFNELRTATKHDIDELRVATQQQFNELRVATKHDIKLLSTRIDNIEIRLDAIEGKLDELASMKRYVVTTGIALAALIASFGIPLLFAVT